MKKLTPLISFLLLSLSLWAGTINPYQKPRIVILATGGTIAGSASSSTDASYKPGVISVEQIIATVPDIEKIANLKGIQVCNISSQNMELSIWLKLYNTIDSLFSNDLCDGVVITHGTDTMEETAYFLNLTIKHSRPVVLTGSMRPSTSLSADGPFNLFNAVSVAASQKSLNRGVMVVINDFILSADDVTKTNTVNTAAFSSPNYGPLGYIRDGEPRFYRESMVRHTVSSEFDIKGLKTLPQVEIVYSYAFPSTIPIKALIEANVKGIVIAGVGHGNYSQEMKNELEKGYRRGVAIIRSTRISTGGVDCAAEDYDPSWPVSYLKNPQKSRILLMLALIDTKDIQRIFTEY
ncbi:MAG: type II asparaginase [Bacteroidales bacterium]|jgi:L-asparaginase